MFQTSRDIPGLMLYYGFDSSLRGFWWQGLLSPVHIFLFGAPETCCVAELGYSRSFSRWCVLLNEFPLPHRTDQSHFSVEVSFGIRSCMRLLRMSALVGYQDSTYYIGCEPCSCDPLQRGYGLRSTRALWSDWFYSQPESFFCFQLPSHLLRFSVPVCSV